MKQKSARHLPRRAFSKIKKPNRNFHVKTRIAQKMIQFEKIYKIIFEK